MLEASHLEQIFSKHLPPAAISYCLKLWKEQPFHFKVTSSRKSKLGDFRYRRDQKLQTITLNVDLNPYQFLLTYIHEVAHLYTFVKFGFQISPHGKEWKSTFQSLLFPILAEQFFPIDILIPLRKHMKNPKASSAADLFLMKEMSKYDLKKDYSEVTFLSDLKVGSRFLISGREFEKGETRRTRSVCLEIKSGKKFLIAVLAKVQPL
ncbi:SprT-like domain-containing protein [Algoriphagus pacificus]|uniref:SprT-like domain-containing protein n=1 Tax=Algoriphagus pacificus TaxID=2811234 RepID=A0ABS3CCU7_9BACT|nr:SprT-like domain-containing protein [Algoriphagus pacificus]MBN7814878.1 SprT-like domain-containing protein [Algoriphagus pacificus]